MPARRRRRAALLLPLLLAAAPPAAAAAEPAATALTLFGGVLTKENWEDALLEPWASRLEDGGIAALHASRRLAEAPLGGWGALEAEAEAILDLHWGAQDLVALAAAGVARWRTPEAAPPASLAFSLGLSAASEVPEAERATQGGASAVMVYWAIELEAGPLADSPWSLALRLHHRSSAYGLFNDKGGSNAWLIGLRRRF